MNMPASHYIDAPAGRIRYHEAGEGPVIILLHGGGPGAYGFSNYRLNMDPLAAMGFRVIVPDMPGYGETAGRSFENGLFAPGATAVLDILDHLGLEKESLVGNSMGGGIALRLALDHPGRVDKMILMGPGGSLPATSTFPTEGLLRMINFYEGEGPTLEKLDRVIDLLVHDRSSITPELVAERLKTATLPETLANPPLRGQAHHPANELWRADIDKLEHKTLLIWGQEDRVLPLDMAFILLKRIPNADLHVFSKCGHWAQWERSDEFNELVANFVAR